MERLSESDRKVLAEKNDRTTRALHSLTREELDELEIKSVVAKTPLFAMERVRYMSERDAEVYINQQYANKGP